jgi:hypothetical protein
MKGLNKKEAIRMNRLAGLITEGQEKQLNEAQLSKLEQGVAELYAYTSIDPNYNYDEKIVRKFGQDVVDAALKMAPKVLAYKKKLKQMAKEIESSDEGKILLAMVSQSKGYGGSHNTDSSIGDLFRLK